MILILIGLVAGLVLGLILGLWRSKLKPLGSYETQAGLQQLRSGRWRDLAHAARDVFITRGYEVVNTVNQKDALGVDLIASKPGDLRVISCKHVGNNDVTPQVVQELLSLLPAKGANGGVVVTTGKFSEDAKALAQGRPLELIDGDGLWHEIKAGMSTEVLQRVTQSAQTAHQAAKRQLKMIAGLGGVLGLALGAGAHVMQAPPDAMASQTTPAATAIKVNAAVAEAPSTPSVAIATDTSTAAAANENSTQGANQTEAQTASIADASASLADARDPIQMKQDLITRVLASPAVMLGNWTSDSTMSITWDAGVGVTRQQMIDNVCLILKEGGGAQGTRLQIETINSEKPLPVMFYLCR